MKHFLKFWVSRKKDLTGKLHNWWDIGKKKIRNRCQKFSKSTAKEKREKRTALENKLQKATISTNESEKENVPLTVHVSEQTLSNTKQMRNLHATFSVLRTHVNPKKSFKN